MMCFYLVMLIQIITLSIKDVLEFDDEKNIDAFKELCKMQCSDGNSKFSFEDLEITLEQIEDDKDIRIV